MYIVSYPFLDISLRIEGKILKLNVISGMEIIFLFLFFQDWKFSNK